MVRKTSSAIDGAKGRFVLGVDHFDRISAVEGLAPTADLVDAFDEMTRLRLSPEDRLRFLKAKYGQPPASR